MTSQETDTKPLEKRAPDYRDMALAKCYSNEARPASEQQTMAAGVCSAALKLAHMGAREAGYPDGNHWNGYVGGDIDSLHRAADYIASIPAQIEAAKEEALREFVERLPDLSGEGIALTELAYNLVCASRVDASGWMAGTAGAAQSHERAKQKFNDAVAKARLGDMADLLLIARSVAVTREKLRAAIRSRGEAAK